MAKLRNDARNSNNNNNNGAQIRSTQNSKKSDRWQPLRGWVTTVEKDDTDIESWAKRRRQAENRAARSTGRPGESLPSSIASLCEGIEDAAAFREQSLCESLDPQFGRRKDPNNRGKFVQRANDNSESGPKEGESNPRGVQDGIANKSNEAADDQQTTADQKLAKSRSRRKEDGGEGITSAVARAQRLVSLSRLNNGKNSDDGQGREPGEENAPNRGDGNHVACPDSTSQIGGNPSEEYSDQTGANCKEVSQAPDACGENARTVKLSYSQSNITLRNPYWGGSRANHASSGCKRSKHLLMFTEGDDRSDQECFHSSDCQGMSSDKTKSRAGTTPAYPNGEREVGKTLSHVDDPASIHANATFQRGSPWNDEAGKSAMPHRQVSLVLKKVSIQDSGIPDESNKARSGSTPLLPRSATKQHPSGLPPKNDVMLNHHMVPLGELLPAVEQNISYRMLSTNNSKTSPDADADEEIYVLNKESIMPNKEKLLSYEDSLIMMREGMELIKLKERQQSILGPPAFRPHPNKTPLQRAKENSSKRIYGQLNYTGNISYTDINKLRWKSASGTLYTGTKHITDADSETKSAPPTASSNESAAEQQGYAFRSHFYGFTTAESCPDSLSAALIKAGIDPVNNLYQLSKRRKPLPGRPLGGYTAFNTDSSNAYKRTESSPMATSDPLNYHMTEADLGHIRGKVGPKMAEVIRRRTRRIEIHDDAKS
ncbi:hypothetical protein LSH36_1204g01012 [Paralvinella palmiformis]|uniref:Uncharacterized protein n=1 Tax=Paralvinella palmiformis TaxID=53620 RepID=A0AAD9IUR7_9ANNE|nr:hypothetical protein LSH36_1204g01012 [Paralvinella palmiformis]